MFLKIPSLLLKQLYTFGSLANTGDGVRFTLKNRLSDATVTKITAVTIDGLAADPSRIAVDMGDGALLDIAKISKTSGLEFPLKKSVILHLGGFAALARGNHDIVVTFEAAPFGELDLKVTDAIAEDVAKRLQIPYDKEDDHNQRMAEVRQKFLAEQMGQKLQHVDRY
ncbi:MAG: hydroxymethylglutaryl-CoA reductase, partial [Thermoanaerobaculia bacterium]